MSPPSPAQVLRLERLRLIAAERTEMIYHPRTRAQLRGQEPVARWAAVTSEGTAESSRAINGNLLVADTREELAIDLAREVSEGWPTHGLVWDLDGEWDPYGNVAVAHRVDLIPAEDSR